MIFGSFEGVTVALESLRWTCRDRKRRELLETVSARYIEDLTAPDPDKDRTVWNAVSEELGLIEEFDTNEGAADEAGVDGRIY